MQFKDSVLLRYGGVVLSTGAAFAATSLLRHWHIPGIFPSFFAAVVFASWIAGFGGALLSTGLSSLAICWFLPPVRASALNVNAVISLLMFVALALFAAAVSTKVMGMESMLSAALTSLQDAVLVTDARGRVTFLNSLAQALTGWSMPEARGLPAHDVLCLYDSAGNGIAGAITPALGGRESVTLAEDLVLKSRSGTRTAVEASLSPIKDRAGRRRGSIVVFRDVTERRSAMESLQRTTETLRALLSTAPLAIWTVDLEGNVTFWNPAAERMFGWGEGELLGRSLPVIPQEQRDEFRGLLERYRHGESLNGVERLRLKKDGTTIWTNVWAVPLRDVKSAVTGTLGLVLEINERKKAEQALVQSRAQLVRSQAIAHLGSWERDVVSNQIYWSEETYRIFGIPPGQVVTLSAFLNAVHPQDRDRVRLVAQEALRSRKTYSVEHRILRPDGSERIVQEQAEVVVDPETGNPIRLMGAVQDITEHRRLEEQFRQAQKMEAVGRLAGSIAHDFNNLLTVIAGYGELLVGAAQGSAEIRESAEEVVQAANRAAELTRRLLAFSRRQIFEPQTLSMNQVVAQMERMLARLIGEDVRLSTSLASDLWPINADVGQIEQVIMNLAVNARDAMCGGGTLTIETGNVVLDEAYAASHLDVKAGNYALLAVSDTGCGMTAEVQARLFEPFFTTKEKGRGTGLGLSTAYGIVKQSGGHIGVYSEAGRGSTFKVYLPQANKILQRAPSGTAPVRAAVSAKTILVVEDEEGVRKLACTILEHSGHEVLAAATAAEALEIFQRRRQTLHLLISDLVLPDMSGADLAAAVQKQAPEVRILLMSGYSEQAAANQQVLTAGAEFLEKPFTPSRLLGKIEDLFGFR